MKKAELMARANRFYPDGHLSEYFDKEGEFVDNPDGGDGLARFIVSELNEAVDYEQTDEVIIAQATRAMHRAMDEICSVIAGLDGLVNWRLQ